MILAPSFLSSGNLDLSIVVVVWLLATMKVGKVIQEWRRATREQARQ